MRDPGLAAVLSAIIPGVGQLYNGRILAGILWLIITPGLVDRDGWSARLGLPRSCGLHRLHVRPRSPGTYLRPGTNRTSEKLRSRTFGFSCLRVGGEVAPSVPWRGFRDPH
jgi:hypothetical protein